MSSSSSTPSGLAAVQALFEASGRTWAFAYQERKSTGKKSSATHSADTESSAGKHEKDRPGPPLTLTGAGEGDILKGTGHCGSGGGVFQLVWAGEMLLDGAVPAFDVGRDESAALSYGTDGRPPRRYFSCFAGGLSGEQREKLRTKAPHFLGPDGHYLSDDALEARRQEMGDAMGRHRCLGEHDPRWRLRVLALPKKTMVDIDDDGIVDMITNRPYPFWAMGEILEIAHNAAGLSKAPLTFMRCCWRLAPEMAPSDEAFEGQVIDVTSGRVKTGNFKAGAAGGVGGVGKGSANCSSDEERTEERTGLYVIEDVITKLASKAGRGGGGNATATGKKAKKTGDVETNGRVGISARSGRRGGVTIVEWCERLGLGQAAGGDAGDCDKSGENGESGGSRGSTGTEGAGEGGRRRLPHVLVGAEAVAAVEGVCANSGVDTTSVFASAMQKLVRYRTRWCKLTPRRGAAGASMANDEGHVLVDSRVVLVCCMVRLGSSSNVSGQGFSVARSYSH